VSDDPGPVGAAAAARAAAAYVRRGLAFTRAGWGVHIWIFILYATPAAGAAALARLSVGQQSALWRQVAILLLPAVTAILGTVVVMVVVGHQAHGRRIGVIRASIKALPWVPRYFWTNVHTTVIFWVPVGLVLLARGVQLKVIPLGGPLQLAVAGLWWFAIAVVALLVHTRTLLAPFLAIHGDLPGTHAALEAWRLSGRHFALCLSTLVLAGAPLGLPILGVFAVLLLTLPAPALAVLLAGLESLLWVAVQAIRPILIPAVYALYRDLWEAELARRTRDGEPSLPPLARLLLQITRPLPHPGRWSGSLTGEEAGLRGFS
jgi:hypothetical protein